MDLALDITSTCQIKVLLIPVPPIKSLTFSKHVEMVRQFHTVRLGDVTPNLQKGTSAKFNSQAFREGQMHFQFVTRYDREHVHLEDFQPHRRIFGVVGIMDCKEWQDKDLSEGCKKFKEMLKQYPTAIATRCFAFDPTENQPDDTKGLIMIPNVGNMSFYMSTMICDFASEVLDQFAFIAERIERLTLLKSPHQATFLFSGPTSPGWLRKQTTNNVPIRPQPSMSTPQKSTVNSRQSQAPAPMPTPSLSSSFLRRAATSASKDNRKSLVNTTTTALDTNSPSATMEPPPSPRPSMTRSTTFSKIMPPTIDDESKDHQTRQRTPGRIKKLLGDFYLLAGRLPDALAHYHEAIHTMQRLQDYLWLASAKEGLACTMILMTCLRKEEEKHIVSRPRLLNEDDAIADPTPSFIGLSSPFSASTSTVNGDKREEATVQRPVDIVSEITDLYKDIIENYANVFSTLTRMPPKLIYAEACLKIARFLTKVYINEGWDDHLSVKLFHCVQQQRMHRKNRDTASFCSFWKKGSGLSRFSIAQWMTKLWSMNMDDLTVLEQIHVFTHMSSVLSTIGYHRKSAWILYETLNRMLPMLIQDRAAMAGWMSDPSRQKRVTKDDDGILKMLRRIYPRANDRKEGSFGWVTLQMDVLRECIIIAEAIHDHASLLHYTEVLLRNLYKYISKEEQIRLASSIQRITHAHPKTFTPALNVQQQQQQQQQQVNHWGFNLIQSIVPVPLIAHKAIYQHPGLTQKGFTHSEQKRIPSDDPFIYNPFSKKKKEPEIHLIKNEVCEFRVVMTNPFDFDLDIHTLVLSTSGVSFSSVPSVAVVPANDSVELILTGTPLETGALIIRGCRVKIMGFAEQEFLLDDQQDSGKSMTVQQQQQQQSKGNPNKVERDKSDPTGSDTSLMSSRCITLNVIEEQPLLNIKSTSILHGAIMLFEGEKIKVTVEVENIGKTPVDYLTLSFMDSTTMDPQPVHPEWSMAEQYEAELYTKGTPVFCWEDISPSTQKDGASSEEDEPLYAVGKRIDLEPGQSTTVNIGVYGKQGCTFGAIFIVYGYLNRQKTQASSKALPTFTLHSGAVYTRQLYLPVHITVHQHLEAAYWDVLHLRDYTVGKRGEGTEPSGYGQHPLEQLLSSQQQQAPDDEGMKDTKDQNVDCLLTFDLRNTWTVPLDVAFAVDKSDDMDTSDHKILYTLTIQPSITKRIVLPLKKLYLSTQGRMQAVPCFDPNKQFVVSQRPKLAPEEERARREMFWYREQLLARIQATWKCSSSARAGRLQLRSSLHLSARQLAVLTKQDIELFIHMPTESTTAPRKRKSVVKEVGYRQFECFTNELAPMHITIRNKYGK
ncbi:TRAPP II complex [Mycotypha africana]|uniref:TRAPP II complex n=1 Tax=Mycotypha africana TaxID=64632 RepID=UPI0023003107|nr:TRAPP II complex [Mycotypha africana]KAI8991231.1 TRAPP II complex [Mycotypha africana]